MINEVSLALAADWKDAAEEGTSEPENGEDSWSGTPQAPNSTLRGFDGQCGRWIKATEIGWYFPVLVAVFSTWFIQCCMVFY